MRPPGLRHVMLGDAGLASEAAFQGAAWGHFSPRTAGGLSDEEAPAPSHEEATPLEALQAPSREATGPGLGPCSVSPSLADLGKSTNSFLPSTPQLPYLKMGLNTPTGQVACGWPVRGEDCFCLPVNPGRAGPIPCLLTQM